MKKTLITLLLLLLCAGFVHLLYEAYITPEAIRHVENARQAGESAPQTLTVILKDVEQQICLTLGLWCLLIMGGKFWSIWNDSHIYSIDFVGEMLEKSEEESDEKTTLRQTMAEIEKLPQRFMDTPVVETLLSSIRRYLMTNDVHNTSEAISLSIDGLAMRQETENTMIRFIIWAVPSIGFIGTVRGIGLALTQADEALAGDITLMTDSLGVAFNSTLVALCLSVALMLLLHALLRMQDGQLIQTQAYCKKFLLNRISK